MRSDPGRNGCHTQGMNPIEELLKSIADMETANEELKESLNNFAAKLKEIADMESKAAPQSREKCG